MEKVLITGANGFIGSNLIKKLLKENIEVWAVVRPSSETKEKVYAIEGVHCIESTIETLEEHLSELPESVDAVYHLAWQGVNAIERDIMEIQIQNVELCLESMRFAAKINAKKFILPGSTSEYWYYQKPINKDALPSPQNAYGSAKVSLRFMAELYAMELGLEFIYVVIAGIYAADRRDNNVIFYTIDKLLKKEKPALTKLEQLWDFVHIDDVVEAMYLIGKNGKANAFYTVGHGDNQPLYKYIEQIHEYIDPTLPIGIGEVPYKDECLPCSCIDLTAVCEDTGYVPKIDFCDGIKEVIDAIKTEMEYDK